MLFLLQVRRRARLARAMVDLEELSDEHDSVLAKRSRDDGDGGSDSSSSSSHRGYACSGVSTGGGSTVSQADSVELRCAQLQRQRSPRHPAKRGTAGAPAFRSGRPSAARDDEMCLGPGPGLPGGSRRLRPDEIALYDAMG